ncbi:MogA/MoaB family molybdenum cofactor biosynthesis protein [Halapricum hydrolyticum]|uniref:Molybdenum cofactor biosynthesis protein MoaB n=1 Tax=Halapricum hydrolyticum TaxID=2979991 RepID=A0AAE3LFM0_9EURY|nr:molybdenum cofactor biosynthesis protein B [Halapricum hydrolyticum]MCU4718820.1 molybdenum cofactor biosynthesis protein MoaB [Halapricum hydrolyticum]MCU4727772.1 molybdenum cofactor biosynthesis protein MoaB [Halapricum hydrolyticum]
MTDSDESVSEDERTDPAPEGDTHASDHDHDEHDHHEHDQHEHEGHEHSHHEHDLETLGIAILTVSSTRTREEDTAGDTIVAILEGEGHEIVTRDVVQDAYDSVQGTVDRFVNRSDVDAVVTTGGTGVTPDDVTVEAVEPLFEKELPGFGELFRRLSYEEVGTRAIATRATAGIADGVPVFCLPGSESAVRLGAEDIIAEVVGHLAGLARQT